MLKLNELTAIEIASGIKNKKFSSCEVIQAHLDQIHKVNPQLNAVVQFNEDNALQAAKLADEN